MNDPLGLFEEDQPASNDPLGLFEEDTTEKGPIRKKLDVIGDVGANIITGLASIAPAGIAAGAESLYDLARGKPTDFEKLFGERSAQFTYQPKTKEGQEAAEDIGKSGFMQSLNALGAVGHTLPPVTIRPGVKGPRLGTQAEVPPASDIANIISAEKPPPEAVAVPEASKQMELPLENSVQQAAEVKGAAQGQPDLFGPINEAAPQVPPVSPDPIPRPVPTTDQGNVPFHSSVEEIARRQAEGSPQGDMLLQADEAAAQQRAAMQEGHLDLPGAVQDILRGDAPRMVPRNQRGGIDFGAISDQIKKIFGREVKDTEATPTSDATIAAKEANRKKLEAVKFQIPEYMDVNTFQEAVALGQKAPDIKSTAVGQNMQGLNFMTSYHNNPVLKYARKLFTDARDAEYGFSREYVTNKETGLAQAIIKLNPMERVRVNEIMYQLDKNQVNLTPELIKKLNMSEKEASFMQAAKRAADAEYDWRLKIQSARGEKTPPARRGYTPSNFIGDYKTPVMVKDKVVGVLTATTPGEFKMAQKHIRKTHPDAKFLYDNWQDARRPVSGGANKGFVGGDIKEALDLLARVDPDFAKLQNEVNMAINRSASDIFNFNVHNLQKKGVWGEEGNKPWLSAEQNAKARLDSLVKFYEEAARHHSLQEPTMDLNLLKQTEELSNQKNTFKYLDKYLANAKGSYTYNVGNWVNGVFDAGINLLEMTPGVNKFVGPTKALQMSNAVKNKMSQVYMGWFNLAFTAAQLVQPLQTGTPFLALLGNRINAKSTNVAKALPNGMMGFMRALAKNAGYNVKVPDHIWEGYNYGREKGMLEFSEHERAYEGHKSKAGRIYDRTAEASMEVGEKGSRMPMFLSFLDLLVNEGLSTKDALPIADKFTKHAMVDYHPYERPMMYSGLGVLGQHAGGLTTFKHGYAGQQVLLGKELAKKGNAVPIGVSMLNMLAFAGLTGLPWYDELNKLYMELSDKVFGKQQSITESVLGNLPQWSKTGMLSSAMDLNAQGKFSAANMIPDNLAEGLFPQLSGAVGMATSVADLVQHQDKQGLANAAMAVTPSGFKRGMEALVRKDEQGNVLDKNQNVIMKRTPEEWKKSVITGLVPLKEAEQRRKNFEASSNIKADQEAQRKIAAKFDRAVRNNTDIGPILKDYIDRGGDPKQLARSVKDIKTRQVITEQLRLMGTKKPQGQMGARKIEEFFGN